MARYSVNRVGRFSTPDSLAGFVGNPQSLNRYPYVTNDPIALTDPTGLCPIGPVTFNNRMDCVNGHPPRAEVSFEIQDEVSLIITNSGRGREPYQGQGYYDIVNHVWVPAGLGN